MSAQLTMIQRSIPCPNDPEFRSLQKEWYAICSKNPSQEYPASWEVERDEYVVEPERYGADDSEVLPLFDNVPDPTDRQPAIPFDDPEGFLTSVIEVAGLTRREAQVVEWIASGNSVMGDYAGRLANALGVSIRAAQSAKQRAVDKLRDHWAGDMQAQGLVDPRYLNPVQPDEFVCGGCHLIRHNRQRQQSGRCSECDPGAIDE